MTCSRLLRAAAPVVVSANLGLAWIAPAHAQSRPRQPDVNHRAVIAATDVRIGGLHHRYERRAA
jgi:hypothetical protein